MQSVRVGVREKGRPAHAIPGCAAKQAGNQPECSTARFRQIKRAGHVAKDG